MNSHSHVLDKFNEQEWNIRKMLRPKPRTEWKMIKKNAPSLCRWKRLVKSLTSARHSETTCFQLMQMIHYGVWKRLFWPWREPLVSTTIVLKTYLKALTLRQAIVESMSCPLCGGLDRFYRVLAELSRSWRGWWSRTFLNGGIIHHPFRSVKGGAISRWTVELQRQKKGSW